MPTDQEISALWYKSLSEGESRSRRLFHLTGMIPSDPRCKLCNVPFAGIGKIFTFLIGKRQSKKNPQFCDTCLTSIRPGGAEVELTMLFADARGSTSLAEKMSPSEFSRLMNRFYAVATDVLVRTDALIDKLVGDEVIGLFVPGFAGPGHAKSAVRGGFEMLRLTGHDKPGGPWLPIGIGIHTGVAYVGAVGGKDGLVADLTALGDNVNVTARLASLAGPGEILISDAAYAAAGIEGSNPEHRQLELKGKSEPVGVRVLRLNS